MGLGRKWKRFHVLAQLPVLASGSMPCAHSTMQAALAARWGSIIFPVSFRKQPEGPPAHGNCFRSAQKIKTSL